MQRINFWLLCLTLAMAITTADPCLVVAQSTSAQQESVRPGRPGAVVPGRPLPVPLPLPSPTPPPDPVAGLDTTAPRIVQLVPAPGTWVVNNVGLNVIHVTFDEPVSIPNDAISLWTVGGSELTGFTTAVSDQLLIIDFPQPIRNGRLTLVLDYSITDAAGNELDGEIANPMQAALPSGNGSRGGQAVFRINVLQGDANRDGIVDSADGSIVQASLGQCIGNTGFNAQADLNGDGCVNVLDVAVYRLNQGAALPPVDQNPLVLTGLLPDPMQGLFDRLDAITVTFSDLLDEAHLNERTLFLIDEQGTMHVPAQAILSSAGGSVDYIFAEDLPQCHRYHVNISNALANTSGMLLALPPLATLSGFSIPPSATLDYHVQVTNQTAVQINGSASRAVTVEVVGPAGTLAFPVVSGVFAAAVPLSPDKINNLHFTSISSCGVRAAPVSTQVISDNQPPTLHIDFPPDGAELTNEAITVAGRVGDMLSGYIGMTVTVNGTPAVVDPGIGNNGTFEAQNIPLTLGGSTVIEAVASDELGNTRTRQISVTRVEIPEGTPYMAAVGGNSQSAPMHMPLPDPIEVQLYRGDGSPFSGKVVTFNVTKSDGRLSASPNTLYGPTDGSMMLQVNTDTQGIARAWWRLGTDAGCGNNRVEVISRDIAGTILFCASATPGPAAQINIGDGNNQRGEVGSMAPLPFRARVSDGCNGVASVPITFSVTRGGGSVVNLITGETAESLTIPTMTTGHAAVRYLFGPEPGNQTVEANYPGNLASPAVFTPYAVARDESQSTVFRGLVLDNASQPIGGAECVLVVNGQYLPPVYSNDQGQFEISDILAGGPAALGVNGLIATTLNGQPVPAGSFPALHYEELIVVESAVNALPAPVLLPKLNPNNARIYSTTQPTILEVEGVEGLRMIVEPGSMTLRTGMPAPHGTIMSLNQVHHNDIPMPMPDGAAPPFAWTLQPAEATFDPPVRVEYPNMSGLAAGAMAYFLTFDHATGRFEIFASGTVSADGSEIWTDPGSGLTLAGWGCNCPPYSVTGECCIPACVDRGELAGGQIAVQIEENILIASISDLVDTGGGKSCDEIVNPGPPGTISYRYTIRGPTGTIVYSGVGQVLEFNAPECGQYQIEYTASVERDCAPPPKTVSKTVLIGSEPALVDTTSREIVRTFDGLELCAIDDICLLELPAASVRLTTDGRRYDGCCFDGDGEPGSSSFEYGAVLISGSVTQDINIPLPLAGTLVKLLDRIVCEAIGRRIPDTVFECDAGIGLRADGFGISAGGTYAATNCPEFAFEYTELSGEAQLTNQRLEASISVKILGQPGALTAVAPASIVGQVQADGTRMILRLADNGGRLALRGELPIIGNFEIVGIDYNPFINGAFRLELPDPSVINGFRGPHAAGDVVTAEPLPIEEWPVEWLPSLPDQLDQAWSISVASQVIPSSTGPVRISNIAAPDLFGSGGLGTPPDFLSDSFLRLAGAARIGGKTYYASSERFRITQGETYTVGDVTITDEPPMFPTSIQLEVCDGCATVLQPGQTVQLITSAALANGSIVDMTPASAGTEYRVSNPLIATVGTNGLVTAHATGRIFLSAVNESASSSKRITVAEDTITTTVQGYVILEDGTPVGDADIAIVGIGELARTTADGAFEVVAVLPAETTSLVVFAEAVVGGESRSGSTAGLAPVAGGITDAGVIVLDEVCTPGPCIPCTSIELAELEPDGAGVCITNVLVNRTYDTVANVDSADFTVQDVTGTNGINVFGGTAVITSLLDGVAKGDLVEMRGQLLTFGGFRELVSSTTPLSLVNHGSGTLTPIERTIGSLQEAPTPDSPINNVYIRLKGVQFAPGSQGQSFAAGMNYTLHDANNPGQTLVLRINNVNNPPPIVGTTIPFGTVDLLGVVTTFQGAFQIVIFEPSDIEVP